MRDGEGFARREGLRPVIAQDDGPERPCLGREAVGGVAFVEFGKAGGLEFGLGRVGQRQEERRQGIGINREGDAKAGEGGGDVLTGGVVLVGEGAVFVPRGFDHGDAVDLRGDGLARHGGGEGHEVGAVFGQVEIAVHQRLKRDRGEGEDHLTRDVLIGEIAEGIGHADAVEADEEVFGFHRHRVGLGEMQAGGREAAEAIIGKRGGGEKEEGGEGGTEHGSTPLTWGECAGAWGAVASGLRGGLRWAGGIGSKRAGWRMIAMRAGIAALVAAYVLSQFYRAFLAVLAPVLERRDRGGGR